MTVGESRPVASVFAGWIEFGREPSFTLAFDGIHPDAALHCSFSDFHGWKPIMHGGKCALGFAGIPYLSIDSISPFKLVLACDQILCLNDRIHSSSEPKYLPYRSAKRHPHSKITANQAS